MANAKRRKAKRRADVKRAERTPATPETLAKLQRDSLQDLLARDEGGLDAGSVEALLEIEGAFRVIERLLGGGAAWVGDRIGHGGNGDISDGDARRWAIWNIWATEFFRRTSVTGVQIAAVIEARAPVDAPTLKLLRQASGLWGKTKRDFDDTKRQEPAYA
jgi:hypothetical protein